MPVPSSKHRSRSPALIVLALLALVVGASATGPLSAQGPAHADLGLTQFDSGHADFVRGPDGPGRGSNGLAPWDPRPALPFIAGERVGFRLIPNDSGTSYRVAPGTDRAWRHPVWSLAPLRSRVSVLRRRYLSYGHALAAVRAGASSSHSTTVPPPRV